MPKFYPEISLEIEAENEEQARAIVDAVVDAGNQILKLQPNNGANCSIVESTVYDETARRRAGVFMLYLRNRR